MLSWDFSIPGRVFGMQRSLPVSRPSREASVTPFTQGPMHFLGRPMTHGTRFTLAVLYALEELWYISIIRI